MHTGDGRGDLCEVDFDGDSIKDYLDDCPANRNVTVLDFRSLILIPLDPIGASQKDPKWNIRNNVSFDITHWVSKMTLFVYSSLTEFRRSFITVRVPRNATGTTMQYVTHWFLFAL